MESALQGVLQRMQSGSKGIQDDAEEQQAIRQICHSASLDSDHLEEVTFVLWPILLQAIHAPTEWQHFDVFLALIARLTGSIQSGKGKVSAQLPADVVAALLQLCLSFLLHRSEICRLRAVRMVGQLTASLVDRGEEDAVKELSSESNLMQRLLERLHDKNANVRVAAVKVLQLLQGPTQGGQHVSDALLDLLEQETNQAVRVVILNAVVINQATVTRVLLRMQDTGVKQAQTQQRMQEFWCFCKQCQRLVSESDLAKRRCIVCTVNILKTCAHPVTQVAKAAVEALHRISLQDLSLEQRLLVLNRGMHETRPEVRAADNLLVGKWWRVDCAGDALLMVGLLDVAHSHSVAEQALDLLVESNGFDVLAYLQGCSRTQSDLAQFVTDTPSAVTSTLLSRQMWADRIGPQRAFLWRYLVSRAQADLKSGALRAAHASGEGAALLSSSSTTYQDVLDMFLPSSSLQTMEAVRLLAASGPSHIFEAHQLLRVAMECMDWADRPSSSAASTILASIIHNNLWRSSDAPTVGAAEGDDEGWECDLMKHVLRMHHDMPQVVRSILQDIICCITAGCESGLAGAEITVWLQCLNCLSVLMTALASSTHTFDCKEAFTLVVNALIYPGLQHSKGEIRTIAWQCFGKLALLPGWDSDLGSIGLVPKALEALGSADELCVRKAAASALLDAAQAYGTPCLDGLAASGHDLQRMADMTLSPRAAMLPSSPKDGESSRPHSQQATIVTDRISHALLTLLQQPEGASPTSEAAYMHTLAHGLCKILLSQSTLQLLQPQLGSVSSSQPPNARNELLPWLLVMTVHPRTEGLAELRQTLTSFLKEYLGQSALGVKQVCLALVPSLEIALSVDTTNGRAKGLAVQLIHLVVQMGGLSGIHESLLVSCDASDWQADSLQAILTFMIDLLKPNTVKASATKQKTLLLDLSKVLGYFSLHPSTRASRILRLARYCRGLSSTSDDVCFQLSAFLSKQSDADVSGTSGPLTVEEQQDVLKELQLCHEQ